MTWEFTSHCVEVSDLAQFEAAVRKHAALGHCLIKGELHKDLVNESRAGSTSTNDQTWWVCLDFDGLPETCELADQRGNTTQVPLTLPMMLGMLGLKDVSYIVQYSASHGVFDKRIRCHIFILLDRPCTAPQLKQWLIQLNHDTKLLNVNMSLTKTGNAISWPLDISACQNDKLIYIAKPTLVGIPDPMNKQQRIQRVTNKIERFVLPSSINSTTANRQLTTKRTDELREAAGLPKRKTLFRMHGSTEVMVKPDACVITEMKQERGFVYFNLNGGDSWAYYHPESNPDYIYNFKGEPTYATKELLPDYWEELTHNGARVTSQGTLHLGFCDRKTSDYWRGTYDASTDVLDLYAAKNETQVRHFAKQVGMPLGDFIPEWDLLFDPQAPLGTPRVDLQTKTINTFVPSPYMLVKPKLSKVVPPTILKVITNALGGKQEVINHFVNWLAYIVQKRAHTKTAWILHGRTKTGKGVLMNNILRPLLGQANTTVRRMEEMDEPFNHYMRNTLLIFVDEVQTKALRNERGVIARLKNFISEPTITIRAMHVGGYEAPNYTNWIFASNMPDPIAIPKDDRRFNVGSYQSKALIVSVKEVEETIPSELQAFYDYLVQFKLDEDAARTVLENDDRDIMISVSESSVDTVASALLDGSMRFFIDHLPTDSSYEQARDKRYDRVETYRAVLRDLLQRTDPKTARCNLGREELRTLFDYTVGGMPESPNKFTSLLKHHRIHASDVWVNNRTVKGMRVTFKDFKDWKEFAAIIDPPKIAKAGSVMRRVK